MLNFTKRTDELVSRVSLYAELFQHLSIVLSSFKFCFNQIDRFRPIRDILHEIKRFRQKQSTKFGMTNFNKRCAFTLSELLLSLIIVGVVAIITVPVLINNVQKKVFATQVKNFAAQIEQVAQDELIAHRTRDLFNTDFADKNKLLTSEHFRIAKTCEPETSLTDCWKTQLTGKDKVIYKLINKSYHTSGISWKDKTIILKNGIMLTYDTRIDSGVQYGCFHFDINGTDKPNIAGRDWFAFCVNKKGHVIAWVMELDPLATKMSNCKIHKYAPYYCYGALADNNWKMDY